MRELSCLEVSVLGAHMRVEESCREVVHSRSAQPP